MAATMQLPAALHDSLIDHANRERSAQLNIQAGGHPLGCVVLHRGRIAWAVCREQTETLGAYLRRLGKVNQQQLEEVSRRYTACQGRRKLGALLEESGYIKRPVLRRCLLLHTRMALAGFARQGELEVVDGRGPLVEDEELTFSLEEIMDTRLSGRSDGAERQEQRAGRPALDSARCEGLLDDLLAVPGCRAAAVISADGEILAGRQPDGRADLTVLGVSMVTVLEDSERAVEPSALGGVRLLLLECRQGMLLSRWLDAQRWTLVALLLDPEGNLGMAKYRLENAAETMADLLAAGRPRTRSAAGDAGEAE
jgi:predicted regulator of Ras-like GTPase activity (Roadblock/LC7/MglB family)